jgi:hypothetical protein
LNHGLFLATRRPNPTWPTCWYCRSLRQHPTFNAGRSPRLRLCANGSRSHVDTIVLETGTMNWKWKSRVQRACAGLPLIQEPAYYLLQSTFGNVRNVSDPFPMLKACTDLAAILGSAGQPVAGARIMEVGTGRCVNMPLGFFLCGASSVVTFDLHPYLRPALVMASLDAMRADKERVMEILKASTDANSLRGRLEALFTAKTCDDLLRIAKIEYRAPADAAQTGLPDQSIDIQVSYTVFEHIPREVLRAILQEARRILTPDGFALHHIDPSDHFSHDDHSILPINFLRYSDAEWTRLAGNQFGYHNRMRASEFADLYSECGHEMLFWKPYVDEPSLRALKNGFPLDRRFHAYPAEVLSTVVLQVLSQPRHLQKMEN